MKAIDILNAVLKLGPKAKAAWPIILVIIAQLQALAAVFAPEAAASGGLELNDPTPEELAAEAQLSALLSEDGTQAVIDLSSIRTIIALARSVPQIATLLAGLLDFLNSIGK